MPLSDHTPIDSTILLFTRSPIKSKLPDFYAAQRVSLSANLIFVLFSLTRGTKTNSLPKSISPVSDKRQINFNSAKEGCDGWMASLTQWTWVWVNSGSWWWTGRPGMLRFMGSQRVGHNWVTELNLTERNIIFKNLKHFHLNFKSLIFIMKNTVHSVIDHNRDTVKILNFKDT